MSDWFLSKLWHFKKKKKNKLELLCDFQRNERKTEA